jgi:hypothetical protein
MADGFSIRVYTNDHGPPHVHAWKAGGWVALTIPTEQEAAIILRTAGMRDSDVRSAVRLVEENAPALWTSWRHYHGEETG